MQNKAIPYSDEQVCVCQIERMNENIYTITMKQFLVRINRTLPSPM